MSRPRTGMPGPETDDQRLLLQAVWTFLGTNQRWPTFAELDRTLYRNHDVSAEKVVEDMPAGLLARPMACSPDGEDDSREVALTVAAVRATGQGGHELELFLSVVRMAVECERHFQPPVDRLDASPVVTSTGVADHLGLRNLDRDGLLVRVCALLRVEPWGWTAAAGCPGPAWEFEIGRGVRKFRAAASLAEYWSLRGDPSPYAVPAATSGPADVNDRSTTSAPAATTPAGTATSRTPGAGVVLLAMAVVTAVFTGIAAGLGTLSTVALTGAAGAAAITWLVRPRRHLGHHRTVYPMALSILVALFLVALATVVR